MTVIVAGAAGVVGGTLVSALLGHGHTVYALDRDEAGLDRLSHARDPKARLIPMSVELEDEERVRELIARIGDDAQALDAIALSLGGPTPARRFVDGPITDWWARFRARVLPHVTLLRCAVPPLTANGGGRVLLINGGQAFRPEAGRSAIALAAAAQLRLRDVLEVECGAAGLVARALVLAAPVRGRGLTAGDESWLDGRDVGLLMVRMLEAPEGKLENTLVVRASQDLHRSLDDLHQS